MKHLLALVIIWVSFGSPPAFALPCDDENKDVEVILSMVEEMQNVVESSESSPEHFCKGGRLEIAEFFKKSMDQLNSYSECPTIGTSAKRYIDLFQKQKADLDYYIADICK